MVKLVHFDGWERVHQEAFSCGHPEGVRCVGAGTDICLVAQDPGRARLAGVETDIYLAV